MARRNSSVVGDLAYIVLSLIGLILLLVQKIIALIYYSIMYKKTNYKIKSDLSFLKVYFNKGNFGEFRLFIKLRKQNVDDNLFVNTYLLHNGNTDETEIDVLAVNKYGVFVYEMKNYSGSIYGKSEDKYWTQVLGRRKFQFFNPFRQNYAHIKALECAIPKYASYITPIVVFSDRSKLSKVKLRNNDIIRKISDVTNLINKKSVAILTDEEVEEIVRSIKGVALTKSQVMEKHIKQVNILQQS